jgi:hypothetical protein
MIIEEGGCKESLKSLLKLPIIDSLDNCFLAVIIADLMINEKKKVQ